MNYVKSKILLSAAIAAALGISSTTMATEPCGDLGECKTLVEINSSDGDVGFHFLMDGGGFIRGFLYNPEWRKIFNYVTRRDLREQSLTETFA